MAVINQVMTDNYAMYHADCMEVMPTLKAGSVGFSIYSPPFPELYQYSNDPRDMSNCTNYDEGIEQYRYIVREVHRLTMPGRISAVHCMDLKDGQMYQTDFPGDIVRVHREAGFHFFCRVTIWKDPWLIARRTRLKSLMHKTLVNDSSKARVAGPDYVLVFRKGGENPNPIRHSHGLKTYAGEREVPKDLVARFLNYTGDQKKNLLSHWIWRAYASPVWMDIRTGRLLPFQHTKENEDEQHVCPLQLDVVERCLTLWSNPEDVVLTPFMGVGSEVFMATRMGRKALGIELKATYFNQACKNVKMAVDEVIDAELPMFSAPDLEPELSEMEIEDDS
jgi:DNA modification methylase